MSKIMKGDLVIHKPTQTACKVIRNKNQLTQNYVVLNLEMEMQGKEEKFICTKDDLQKINQD